MKLNTQAKQLILAAQAPFPALDPGLQRIAEEGFVCDGDCHLLRHFFAARGRTPRHHFPDEIGFEVHVNSFHVEDHVSNDPFRQGLAFLCHAFAVWKAAGEPQELVGLISADKDAPRIVVVRLHVQRAGQYWAIADLESYDQPVGTLASGTDTGESIAEVLRYL